MNLYNQPNVIEIKSQLSDSYLDHTIKNGIDFLIINTGNGYNNNNLTPYCYWEHITGLKILIDVIEFNYNCIFNMKWLRKLFFNQIYLDDYYFNFSNLLNLQLLSIDWNKKIEGLENLNNLNSLHLGKFKGNPKIFSNYPLMEDFGLTQGNINVLDFLKYFPSLKKLYLAYIPTLKDSKGLKFIYETIEEIDIDGCPNLSLVDHLPNFKNLKLLRLQSKEQLPNLKWASRLKKLEFLALGDTNVIDGDFSHVKDVKYVSMQDKRHYNYRFDRETMKIAPK